MTEPRACRTSLADALDFEMPLDAAAAKAAVDSVALINKVVDDSGLLQSALAKALGVTEGRVSQVLNGDGNVRIATLARFLKAAGYELDLKAKHVDDVDDSKSEWPTFVARKIVTCFSGDQLYTSDVVEFSDTHPDARLHEEYTYVGNLQSGEAEDLPRPVKREPSMVGMKLVSSEVRRVRA
ncbi:helix-turn-helix domain-containing protein [Arthrobacter sp. MDT1-65]